MILIDFILNIRKLISLPKELQPRLQCALCKEIMVTPTQTECGCRFCLNCIEEYCENGKRNCPICEEEVIERDKIIKDRAVEKEIMNTKVKCINEGCLEIIFFKYLEDHLKQCYYRNLKCHNCGETYRNNEKDNHIDACRMSLVKCNDCGIEMTREDYENKHKNYADNNDNICEQWCTICPYNCDIKEEVNLRNHIKYCLKKDRNCVLTKLGCEEKGPHELIEKHMEKDLGKHQLLMMNEINNMKKEKEILKVCFEEKEQQMNSYIQELLKTNSILDETIKELTTRINEIESGTKLLLLGIEKYKNPTKSNIKEIFQEITLTNNEATWTIKNIRQKITEAQTGGQKEIVSKTFYITRPGYNFSIKIYLNGDGRAQNTYLSVFFVINKGEYDNLISWPFKTKVILSLLSNKYDKGNIIVRMKPDNNEECYGQPSKNNNLGAGQPQFAKLSSILYEDYFLHDGSLKIKLKIENDNFTLDTFFANI